MFNAGRTAVDNIIYYLSIAASIPEMFAVKVESCPKLPQILGVVKHKTFPNYRSEQPNKQET